MSKVTVNLKTIITDGEGNLLDHDNLDKYIGQNLKVKIVQADRDRIIKEFDVVIKDFVDRLNNPHYHSLEDTIPHTFKVYKPYEIPHVHTFETPYIDKVVEYDIEEEMKNLDKEKEIILKKIKDAMERN